jgi:GNAT superfamily N-acetyltransferase
MFREMGGVTAVQLASYEPVFRAWFRKEYRSHRIRGYVAVTAKDEVVAGGLVWLQPRHPSPRFRRPYSPYILSMFTEPAHRKQGLASRLVRALVTSARSHGDAAVELHATAKGRRVYERQGFRSTNQMRLEFAAAGSAGPLERRERVRLRKRR